MVKLGAPFADRFFAPHTAPKESLKKGAFGGLLGVSWRLLEPLGSLLGASWGVLERLGSLMRPLGSLLGALGALGSVLGRLGSVLGASWAPLRENIEKMSRGINLLDTIWDPKMRPLEPQK